jgi:hypothetical protein
MEIHIAILNGDGIHPLAHANRSVIYYGPGAEPEPAPRLTDLIGFKVILGHDLGLRQRTKPRSLINRGSQGLSPARTAARANPINRFQMGTGLSMALITA